MKHAFLTLALLGSIVAIASPAQAKQICGQVFIGEQCDVDYCAIGFIAPQANGTLTHYGINGFRHDYDITPALVAANGKRFCVDDSQISGFGTVELEQLVPQ